MPQAGFEPTTSWLVEWSLSALHGSLLIFEMAQALN